MVKLHLSMNKKYYLLWMLVVLLPFLAGCSDDEQPEVAEPYLRVVETTSCENISSAAAYHSVSAVGVMVFCKKLHTDGKLVAQ